MARMSRKTLSTVGFSLGGACRVSSSTRRASLTTFTTYGPASSRSHSRLSRKIRRTSSSRLAAYFDYCYTRAQPETGKNFEDGFLLLSGYAGISVYRVSA